MSNDTIQLNFKADTFEEAISQAIVVALGSGMSPPRNSRSAHSKRFSARPRQQRAGRCGAGTSRFGRPAAP